MRPNIDIVFVSINDSYFFLWKDTFLPTMPEDVDCELRRLVAQGLIEDGDTDLHAWGKSVAHKPW